MAGNRNPNGTFAAGNGGGPGNQPRRDDARWHLRRVIETPESELPKVPMCPGDKLARKMLKAALAAKSNSVIGAGRALIETAYGTTAALTGANGAPLFSRIERVIVPAKPAE